ncbi:Yip1 family protein [Lysinibacillus sphaericus]|uniref:Yip1 family protein n=1 Tax=Lysinibacillus sphaericus TaxID=1421 RepID=UPI003F792B83
MENYNETTQERQKVNPFLNAWIHPKQTARYMIDVKSVWYAILIMSIGYIGLMLTELIDKESMLDFSPWLIILFCIILSPISGTIGTAISAFITWLVGKLFKGTASYSDLFKGLSLTAIPYTVLIPLFIIWLFISPESLMDANFAGSVPWIFWLSTFATVVVAIWSVVISVGVVAEAHQFSNWKAFFTIFIPSIIIFIIILVLVLVIFIGAIGIGMM